MNGIKLKSHIRIQNKGKQTSHSLHLIIVYDSIWMLTECNRVRCVCLTDMSLIIWLMLFIMKITKKHFKLDQLSWFLTQLSLTFSLWMESLAINENKKQKTDECVNIVQTPRSLFVSIYLSISLHWMNHSCEILLAIFSRFFYTFSSSSCLWPTTCCFFSLTKHKCTIDMKSNRSTRNMSSQLNTNLSFLCVFVFNLLLALSG